MRAGLPPFLILICVLRAMTLAASEVPELPGTRMEYGPVLSCTVEAPPVAPEEVLERAKKPAGPAPPPPSAMQRIVARKGLVIALRDEGTSKAFVCFDTDTLRIAAGWSDGFLDLSETNIGTYKGNRTGAAMIDGAIVFRTADGPGWSLDDGNFADPREHKTGPMPKEKGRFKGFYLHNDEVILCYQVGGIDVLEKMDWMIAGSEKQEFINRTINIPATRRVTMHCLVATGGDLVVESRDDRLIILKDNPRDPTSRLAIALFGDTKSKWDVQPGRISLLLAAGTEFERFAYWHGSSADLPKLQRAIHAFPGIENLQSMTAGGRLHWPNLIESAGTRAADDAPAYVVDTIPMPDENPWKSWMRISAFDFFPDGRAAVATLNGDVWVVSGLDDSLAHVRWKRFAVGLYEPLGLKIADGNIYVHGRDRITRLHDLNADGEADFYESFNSDRIVYPSYHAYAYDLQTDRAGNFYYVVGGAWLGTERPWHACMVKVTPDGARSEIIATGFRAPNGMAIGPHDEISVSDNQGNWIPASKISFVRPNGFYGFVADPRVEPSATGPASFDQPICWIPQAWDNSSAGQVWAPSSWGPLGGKMLHTSYGAAALFAVLAEQTSDGAVQGGVIKLPLKFDSGIMRARIGPHDQQLYVVGLKGWQTAGAKEGCLQRVRFTGHPFYAPVDLHVAHDAIVLRFAVPLDAATASDLQNYAIEQWNYRWSSTYGSAEYSIAKPGAVGRDDVEIKAAMLSTDRKEIRLSVPHLQPVMQMHITGNVRAQDGHDVRFEIANTIQQVPAR
jgi:hypothetical protein